MTAVPHPERDRGAGTPLALGLLLVVALAGLVLVGAAGSLVTAQRVSAAADAAALAAADTMLGWAPGEPCLVADRVARAHGTVLTQCQADGLTMVVTARSFTLGIVVERSARAGPPGAHEVRTRASCVWCA